LIARTESSRSAGVSAHAATLPPAACGLPRQALIRETANCSL
jgi:hypothetical protein